MSNLLLNCDPSRDRKIHSLSNNIMSCTPEIRALIISLLPKDKAVSIQWTGPLDWTTGLEYWIHL